MALQSKTIIKTAVAIVVLLVLFVGGGIAYVFISDEYGAKHAPQPAPAAPAPAASSIKPKQPSPDAREGAAVESLTSPVSAGSNANIIVRTNAGSACTISVTYNGKASTDSGLAQATADAYGNVSWTWTVDATAPVGKWPVKVTCVYHGRSGVVQGDLEVQAAKPDSQP
jgi:hypothetical protein